MLPRGGARNVGRAEGGLERERFSARNWARLDGSGRRSLRGARVRCAGDDRTDRRTQRRCCRLLSFRSGVAVGLGAISPCPSSLPLPSRERTADLQRATCDASPSRAALFSPSTSSSHPLAARTGVYAGGCCLLAAQDVGRAEVGLERERFATCNRCPSPHFLHPASRRSSTSSELGFAPQPAPLLALLATVVGVELHQLQLLGAPMLLPGDSLPSPNQWVGGIDAEG
jgi:hypothetical protein